LFIGTSCIQLLNGVVDELPSQIGNSILTFDHDGLRSIEKVEGGSVKSQSLFGNTLEQKHHLSMVGALISLNGLNTLKSQNWQNNTSNQKQKKTFYSTVKLCLGLLLFIFMGNMVLNQVLKSKHNEINNEFNQQKGLVNMVEKLQSEAAEKNEFITQLGLEQNPQFALFVDEIGMTVPNSIQLGDLNINPLTKSIRKKKVIDFKNGYINIGGFCKSSQICNEWVTVLRRLNWAEKVELVDFKINKENIGEFNIEVSF